MDDRNEWEWWGEWDGLVSSSVTQERTVGWAEVDSGHGHGGGTRKEGAGRSGLDWTLHTDNVNQL
jgi:hypothetical protein